MVSVNNQGAFTTRPEIGDRYLSLDGVELTIAAMWEGGVVFEGAEFTVAATELLQLYRPLCAECATYHEPEYPHQHTETFRKTIRQRYGRDATDNDTMKDMAPGLADWFALAQQPRGAAA
jgi:hypothetical protein